MKKGKVFKILIRIALWAWVSYWLAQIFIGDLGASPALSLNHKLGKIALVTLSANLVVGILMAIFKRPPAWVRFWVSERRFWGVSGFLVLTLHVSFYFLNEGFESKAWVQLVTKTYLIFALLSFTILFVLAVTSNDFSVRKLGGKRWKRIHRAVYLAQILLFAHILLIEKADLALYLPWLSLLLAFQAARWIVVKIRQRSAPQKVPAKATT